ncbi:hypothetical protein ATO7_06265 [Oceanococcus atlanticus]|uniref:SIR2-like domain-containing protein n=1 Tax=Oceanococcus atlanticus TaxID=1317117 RepID=A0A1Y1SIF5_9GAMM|nr:hypothetical protein [Oceanococcus atlanticus]ORE89462.1 hypothetical protein ATO7_06265 [Oceanococcus atlanticus]
MNEKTVFVVGAGASADFGLPLGRKLKTDIANELRAAQRAQHDQEHNRLRAALNQLPLQPLDLAIERIIAAMPSAESIDNFVHQHRNDKDIECVAKMAIVHCILQAERDSTLCEPDPIPGQPTASPINLYREGNEDSWLNTLFMAVTKGAAVHELAEVLINLTLIVFNYDRCVEHFLHTVFMSHYNLTPAEAAGLVDLITIIHPYGMIGPLPWMVAADETYLAFGANTPLKSAAERAQGIRTFTENIKKDTRQREMIAQAMADAQRIAFLGFAYHRLNLDALKPAKKSTVPVEGDRMIFGTAFDLSAFRRGEIHDELYGRFSVDRSHIHLMSEKDTSSALIKDYFLR